MPSAPKHLPRRSANSEPRIDVFAGVNGAGKSSVAGAFWRQAGGVYYNPDEVARQLIDAGRAGDQQEANAAAWQAGRAMLERAITERRNYAFESTLGAATLPRLLVEAAGRGFNVNVWFVGLTSPELHIQRVAARVARGGHPIPETDIRRRYEQSRLNLIELLPHLHTLQVFDNSVEAPPGDGAVPLPKMILKSIKRRIVASIDPGACPSWAYPLAAAAMRLNAGKLM